MEIVTSWMEQGIEQGIEQGQKGEAITLVLRLISRRVGKITPELESAINDLTLTQLEDLAEALLDFKSIEDLEQWLQQH